MIWTRIYTRTGAFETRLLLTVSLLLWCCASNDANSGVTSIVPTVSSLSLDPGRENALVVPSPSMTSSSSHSVPVLIPSPQFCETGPEYSSPRGRLLSLDNLYFDLSNPIQCSGIITLWQYCHYVIGFNNIPSGIWPCVWRRINTGYSLIGLNSIMTVPSEGSDLRCGNYTPKPEELIQVEVGDIVGFYAPENGLFMAVSPADPYYQLQRVEEGFAYFVNDSDLVNASSSPGRALLRAIIDTTAVRPSTLPGVKLNFVSLLPTPTATALREATMQPSVILFSTTIAAALVIVIIVMLVVCLVICVIRKKRKSLDLPIVPDESMEYNNLYSSRVANEVIVGGHRTVVSIKNNPAYGEVPQQETRSALRRSIEHTYESLSSFAVTQVHRINRNNSH